MELKENYICQVCDDKGETKLAKICNDYPTPHHEDCFRYSVCSIYSHNNTTKKALVSYKDNPNLISCETSLAVIYKEKNKKGYVRTKNRKTKRNSEDDLNENLIIFTMAGLTIFGITMMIGAFLSDSYNCKTHSPKYQNTRIEQIIEKK